ncbi:MAG: ABC transporter permease subunit, partial [Candidatus Eisenbacteria bacterium]|nr:ABC transporter permease subunit [Candidatus Eisenbacteria bacterium]
MSLHSHGTRFGTDSSMPTLTTMNVTKTKVNTAQRSRYHGLGVVARETWRRAGAAKATLAFAIVFSVLALGVSYFGLAGTRSTGFQGFARVTASLLNIVVYIVPLIALILGVTEVTGRKESMAVTLSQPLRRMDYLLGTYLGVAGALATALMIGLGGAGVLIAVQTSTASIAGYLTLLAASLGLMLSFLSLAFLVGVFLLDRLKSTAAAIVIW